MTEDEHDTEPDTDLAPTAAAELAEQTTELPPANHAAATPEAWSLDDTAEVDSDSPRRGRLVSVGLVGLVVVVACALIYFAATLFGSGSSKHVEPSAKPSTTVPVAAPPPTPAPPPAAVPAPTSTPALTDTDRQFLTTLRNGGVNYPYSNPEYPIAHAHAVCDYMNTHHFAWGEDHEGSVDKYVETTTIWYGADAVKFQGYARATYCPSTVNPEY